MWLALLFLPSSSKTAESSEHVVCQPGGGPWFELRPSAAWGDDWCAATSRRHWWTATVKRRFGERGPRHPLGQKRPGSSLGPLAGRGARQGAHGLEQRRAQEGVPPDPFAAARLHERRPSAPHVVGPLHAEALSVVRGVVVADVVHGQARGARRSEIPGPAVMAHIRLAGAGTPAGRGGGGGGRRRQRRRRRRGRRGPGRRRGRWRRHGLWLRLRLWLRHGLRLRARNGHRGQRRGRWV